MASSPRPPDDSSGDQVARSIHLGDRSARLIALSDAARAQLRGLDAPTGPLVEVEPDAVVATDPILPEQMACCHVFVVNSNPAFLSTASRRATRSAQGNEPGVLMMVRRWAESLRVVHLHLHLHVHLQDDAVA